MSRGGCSQSSLWRFRKLTKLSLFKQKIQANSSWFNILVKSKYIYFSTVILEGEQSKRERVHWQFKTCVNFEGDLSLDAGVQREVAAASWQGVLHDKPNQWWLLENYKYLCTERLGQDLPWFMSTSVFSCHVCFQVSDTSYLIAMSDASFDVQKRKSFELQRKTKTKLIAWIPISDVFIHAQFVANLSLLWKTHN